MTRLLHRLKSRLAVATLVLMPLAGAIAAPTVSITGPSSVFPGTSFSLDVVATGVSDLYAFQFDVLFDPALFSATGVTEGAFLASGGATFFDGGTVDNTGGSITFIFNTLIGPGAGVSGSGVLASLSFDSEVAVGQGAFQLANVMALDSALSSIDVTVQGLAVAVPEPAALALSLAALGILAAASGRRRCVPATPAWVTANG